MLSVPWFEALRSHSTAKRLGPRFFQLILLVAAMKGALSIANRRKRLLDAPGLGPACPETMPRGRTVVSKERLPYLLAFVAGWYDSVCFKQYKCYANMMTGNTCNLCMKLGSQDFADVPLLFAAILHFSGGFTLFKLADMKLKGRFSCSVAAPVVFALFALADEMRVKFPSSRWHLLLLAVAGGIINSISAEKGKLVTNMMTGHYQKMSGDVADILFKGGSKQLHGILQSVRVVLTFSSGLAIGAAANKLDAPFAFLPRRKFAIIGAIYAAILLLHELPLPPSRENKEAGIAYA